MYRVKTLNNIVEEGLSCLGQGYEYGNGIQNPEGILVCSAAVYNLGLPSELLAITGAGAGVNNIPVDKRSERGIVVFNTPGVNANAVKRLVTAGLFLTSRKITPALEWTRALKGRGSDVNELAEKGKGQFIDPEIRGKSLGVIGLDTIDILVADVVENLGMEVYGYDPYLSVDVTWGLSRWVHHARALDEILGNYDYLTVHASLTSGTKGLTSVDSITEMRDEVHILNFAHGELVDTASVLNGLKSGKIAAYATNFPSDKLVGTKNMLAIPHLGAPTPGSKENCIRMAVDELKEFLENGDICNPVNMPSIPMSRAHVVRICVFHRNVHNAISRLSGVMTDAGINIENVQSKSRGDYAYTVLDVTGEVGDAALEPMRQMEEIIRLRMIR